LVIVSGVSEMKRLRRQLTGFLLLLFFPILLAGLSWKNFYFLVFSSGWFVIIGLFMFFWIYKPLRELIEFAKSLSNGSPIRTQPTGKEGIYSQLIKILFEIERDHLSHLSTYFARFEELQNLLTSISVGFLATNAKGRICLINQPAKEQFLLSEDQVLGKSPKDVFYGSELGDLFNQDCSKGYPLIRQITWGNPEKVLLVYLDLIKDSENGESCGVFAAITNITEMHQLEKLRKEFIANVSHELKTPLTSIKGFVETLLDGNLEDKDVINKFLQITYRETERLNNLITKLLDISKLDQIKAEILEKKPVMLDKLLEEIILTHTNDLRAKEIELKTDDVMVTIVQGDEDLLRELIINLLDNAIKYNVQGGKIFIGSRETRKGVEFYIKDTGMGIPDECRARLFERFYRVDKGRARTNRSGGSGLGLWIVKQIVDIHKGDIRYISKLGKGSLFSVVIPFFNNEEVSGGEAQ
jgi:two-component system, OmpR family, phosphate regulon sensor histidine kinase PhoR